MPKKISLGNQVHEVLSLMTNSGDCAVVTKQLLLEGTILPKDLPHITERIESLMNNKQVNAWFESDYNVLAEREVFYDDQILKPDRVMVKDDLAIVIDFKKEKASPSHHAQVQRYMRALKTLGYSSTTGFLIYVDSVSIEEVDL